MSIERIVGSVYDHPNLYDVLFSGDCGPEIEFLLRCPKRYGIGDGLGKGCRYFEPACGTGRLLWRLGKVGHEVAGLDLNPKAVAFCNRRFRRHGLPETAVIGDMTAFSLADLRQNRQRPRPFDVAFNFVSSFLHLTDDTSALAHLDAVADALKPDGCYLLGFHLFPRGKVLCAEESWSVRRGSLALHSHLGRVAVDRRKEIETVEFRVKAVTPKKRYEVVDTFPLRLVTVARFRRLLERSGRFEPIEAFDFDFDRPIRVNSKTEDVIYVLRKTA